MVKAKFPKANFEIINIWRGSGKNLGKIVTIGSKGGEYKILKEDESDLSKSFIDSFKNKLGPRAEEIIAPDRKIIQKQRKWLGEVENQERQANNLAAEMKKNQDIQNLKQKVERMKGRIEALKEEEQSERVLTMEHQ